jgi:putative ABC transport system substrate-binding protein
MRRREFITLTAGAIASAPFTARAQQPAIRHMGVIMGYGAGDPEAQVRIAAFREELGKLGWVEGRNIEIDYRFTAADPERMRAYADELVRLRSDLILAQSGQVLATLQKATRGIPIVFVQQSDPVELGFVQSLARPGGNITGFNSYEASIGGKWLQVLKDVAPRMIRAAVLLNPVNVSSPGYLRAIETGAPSSGVEVNVLRVRDGAEIDTAMRQFAQHADRGLIVLPGPFTSRHRDRIIALAMEHRLPAIYPFRYFVVGGGLMSYGVDQVDQWRKVATYVDRILKGEKPGNLPVQQPTKFELALNISAAKRIGLTIPEAFRARVDEVIE